MELQYEIFTLSNHSESNFRCRRDMSAFPFRRIHMTQRVVVRFSFQSPEASIWKVYLVYEAIKLLSELTSYHDRSDRQNGDQSLEATSSKLLQALNQTPDSEQSQPVVLKVGVRTMSKRPKLSNQQEKTKMK